MPAPNRGASYRAPREDLLAPELPRSFNGRYLIQARVETDLYVQARATSRALGISMSRLMNELLRHVVLDDHGRPVGWDDVEPATEQATDGQDQLPLSA